MGNPLKRVGRSEERYRIACDRIGFDLIRVLKLLVKVNWQGIFRIINLNSDAEGDQRNNLFYQV